MKQMWVKKYRPKTLDDYIFVNENHKELVKSFLTDRTFPHLLLEGKAGTGKTSLAYLLKNLFEIEDMDFFSRNASDDNSVEMIRSELKPFISTYPMGEFKIVLLDEADYLTAASQGALRVMIEENSDTVRFILCCNNVHKIIGPLRSRLTELKFEQLDKESMMRNALKILQKESVKVDDIDAFENYLNKSNGDFRKFLTMLQNASVNGKLMARTSLDSNFELKAEAMLHMGNGNWDDARKILCENLTDDEYDDMYRFLYENLDQIDKFANPQKWKAGIVLISDYLYRSATVADKEINLAACLIRLSEV